MGGHEVEVCQSCGFLDYPNGGCACGIPKPRSEILKCQECRNDYIRTSGTVNGPLIFRCHLCSDLRAIEFNKILRSKRRSDRIYKVIGYMIGWGFIAYMILYPFLS